MRSASPSPPPPPFPLLPLSSISCTNPRHKTSEPEQSGSPRSRIDDPGSQAAVKASEHDARGQGTRRTWSSPRISARRPLRRTTEPATPAPTRTTTFVRPMPACASAMAARRPRVTGRGGGGGGNPSSGGPDEVRPREALSWSGGEGGGAWRGEEKGWDLCGGGRGKSVGTRDLRSRRWKGTRHPARIFEMT